MMKPSEGLRALVGFDQVELVDTNSSRRERHSRRGWHLPTAVEKE